MSTQVQWLTPSPLWPQLAAATDKTAFRAPALLRFATDTFMQDLQTQLAGDPTGLSGFVAQPETWRMPAVGLPTAASTVATTGAPSSATSNAAQAPTTLKLYQPVHARFYLVAASLVCRLPALPDHTVKVNQGEKTSFVLRRLQLNSSATTPTGIPLDGQMYWEYAWSTSVTPPCWVPANATGLAPGEERIPLFNLQFGSNGTQRRMFAGVIPVGRKQAYIGAPAAPQTNSQAASGTVADPRKVDFQRQVLDPWADLVAWSANLSDMAPGQGASASADSLAAAQGSAFILIDFANYLSANLPQVWAAVQDASQVSALLQDGLALYQALSTATMGDVLNATPHSLAQAIVMAKNWENDFDSEVLPSPPPISSPPPPAAEFLPGLPGNYPGPLLTDLSDPNLANLIGRPSDTDELPQRPIQTKVEAALDEAGPAPVSAIPSPANNPQNPQGDDLYIVRCVYERPQCAVLNMPAVPILSPPSQVFQLASYFDPDAPARRIQVALPIDTTAAALRKYDKGVAFMISDQLNQQMQRVAGLKDLMNGSVNPPGGGFNLGMICSFSIPIITICAFIVLFIFVILLNIVFFWMPFLKICFPLPTFTAKGGD